MVKFVLLSPVEKYDNDLRYWQKIINEDPSFRDVGYFTEGLIKKKIRCLMEMAQSQHHTDKSNGAMGRN